jgi:hypothetical protein
MDKRDELLEILMKVREFLARSDADFSWSSWSDGDEALEEIDGLIRRVEYGLFPEMAVLFAPTGPIQELSLGSGWGDEFVKLAARFDEVTR